MPKIGKIGMKCDKEIESAVKKYWWEKAMILNNGSHKDAYGNKYWYSTLEGGKLHREDGPAVEWIDGTKQWYLNGRKHREDGPAVEWVDGTKEWWLKGKRHRTDGPAIEYADGSYEWYLNGKIHCEEGPAINYADGSRCWLIEGKLHREDGPAVESPNGKKYWYLNDIEMSEVDFINKTQKITNDCVGSSQEKRKWKKFL